MNLNSAILETAESLHRWAKREEYCGWDPYDALNSNVIKKLCMGLPSLEILATQLNKYSASNLRPLLKVHKGVDTKGMALFAQSFCKMYRLTNDENYLKDLSACMSFLRGKSLRNTYDCDCWAGHYFDYRGADGSLLSPNIPDVVTTTNAMKALVDSYFILRKYDLKEMAKSAYTFLVNSLLRETREGSYLKYTPLEEGRIVINASAEGLGAICRLMSLFENEPMKEVADGLAEFLVKKQKPNGSWAYSEYHTGRERNQIDFHQGFILDGLLEYIPYADSNREDAVIRCIEKGAEFYKGKQFLEDGRCRYRYPTPYPTDIHNQAQGTVTFSKLSILDPEYLDFAKVIAKWTITNMQDDSGYFYYQKHGLFTIRIPYMRWGQAWMMLALATLLEGLRKQKCQTN